MNAVLKQRLRVVNYTGIAAVVLLLSATAALGIYPLVQRGKANIRATRDLETEIADLGSLDDTVLSAKQAIKGAEARLQDVESHLPPASESNFYDKELTKLIVADGIRKNNANTPKEMRDYAGYKVGSVDISGSGDWDSICKFVADIRHMNGLTRLDSATIFVQRNGPSSYEKPICSFTITFSTFFTAR